MPMYEFLCQECQREETLRLTIEHRNSGYACPECGTPMVRLISRPQLITSPIHLRDENRMYHGSATDIKEQMKADDALYEKNWVGLKPQFDDAPVADEGPTLYDLPGDTLPKEFLQ